MRLHHLGFAISVDLPWKRPDHQHGCCPSEGRRIWRADAGWSFSLIQMDQPGKLRNPSQPWIDMSSMILPLWYHCFLLCCKGVFLWLWGFPRLAIRKRKKTANGEYWKAKEANVRFNMQEWSAFICISHIQNSYFPSVFCVLCFSKNAQQKKR